MREVESLLPESALKNDCKTNFPSQLNNFLLWPINLKLSACKFYPIICLSLADSEIIFKALPFNVLYQHSGQTVRQMDSRTDLMISI